MLSVRYDLPSALESAALRTMGIRTRITAEENLTKSARPSHSLLYFAIESANDARRMVSGSKPESPEERAAQPRYRAALAGVINFQLLTRWIAGKCGTPGLRVHTDGVAWLELSAAPVPETYNLLPHAVLSFAESIPFTAAAIACGFYPRPQLLSDASGMPCPSVLQESALEPGLTLSAIAAADIALRARYRQEGIASPVNLGTAAPDEHPFLYARTAIYHLHAQAAEESAAMANPTGLFSGRDGKTALVTRHLLNNSHTAEKNLALFLAGRLP